MKCERCKTGEAKVVVNGQNICLDCNDFLVELMGIIDKIEQTHEGREDFEMEQWIEAQTGREDDNG